MTIGKPIEVIDIIPGMGMWERIQLRMAAVGLKTQPELSEAVKRANGSLPQSQISRIKTGINDRPRALPELARALRTTVEWLVSGDDANVNENGEILRTAYVGAVVVSPVPLVLFRSIDGPARAGELLIYKEKAGEAPRPKGLEFSADAFAVRVRFDDMSPVYEIDDILLIDPNGPIVARKNYLFVRNFKSDPFTGVPRRLLRETPDYWIAQVLFPEPKEVRFPRADWKPCRIVGSLSA